MGYHSMTSQKNCNFQYGKIDIQKDINVSIMVEWNQTTRMKFSTSMLFWFFEL